MVVSYVSQRSVDGGTGAVTSFAVNYPTGLQANDLLVMTLSTNGATNAPSQTGWTTAQSGTTTLLSQTIYYKIATGSESGTFNATSLTSGRWTATMQCFGAVHTTTPIDVAVASENAGTTSITYPTPSGSTAGAMIVALGTTSVLAAAGPPDATWTSSNMAAVVSDAQTTNTASGNNIYLGVAYFPTTATGGTGGLGAAPNLTHALTKIRTIGSTIILRAAPVLLVTSAGTGASTGSADLSVFTPTTYTLTASGTGTSTGSAAVTIPTPITNLIPNPSFEIDMTGWGTGGGGSGTVTRDGTRAQAGSSAALWSGGGSSQLSLLFTNPATLIPATAGVVYSLSFYSFTPTGSPVPTWQVEFLNSGGSSIALGDTSGTASSVPDTWTRTTVTANVSPVGTTYVRVYIAQTTTGTGQTTWVDAVQLTATPVTYPYFDGTTVPDSSHVYAWSGTAHASSSVRSLGSGLSASGTGTSGGSAAITLAATTHQLTAAGTGVSTGSASQTLTAALTASGTGTSAGSAAFTAIQLGAAGTGTTSGSADIGTLLPVTADGTGTTSGSAALAALLDLAAAGTGATDGAGVLLVSTTLAAAGTGTTGGTAELGLQHPGEIASVGHGTTSGSLAFTLTAALAADGTGTTDGSAVITLMTAVTAAGTGATDGAGVLAVTFAYTAAGTGTSAGTARMHTFRFTLAPAERLFTVLAEDRTTTVSAEDRTTTVPTESRALEATR